MINELFVYASHRRTEQTQTLPENLKRLIWTKKVSCDSFFVLLVAKY